LTPGPEEATAALDLASVDQVLSTTRSVRRKLDFERPVPPELLYECINLATQAPMGIGGESWRFLVVTDPQVKARIADLYRAVIKDFEAARQLRIKRTQRALMDRLQDIPAMVLVYSTIAAPGPELARQIGYYGSILPAAWSLMLAMRARGLGSTWTSLLASRQEALRELLGAPADAVLTVMFPVAYTRDAVLRPAQRQEARSVTFWNRWDSPEP
jgi:nitroreductase